MNEETTGILVNVYSCPKCGDVWRIHQGEVIDPDNDEVYTLECCVCCGNEVTEKKVNAIQVMHDLTQSELDSLNSENDLIP